MSLTPIRTVDENPVSIKTEIAFFLGFVRAVAELSKSFGDIHNYVGLIEQLKAGTHTVFIDRKYYITGIAVKDRILVQPTHATHMELKVGHPADFSVLACWGVSDDEGPICFAYWTTEMLAWEPSENQKMLVPFRGM